MNRQRYLLSLLLLLLAQMLYAQAPPTATPKPELQMVTMRDGVKLATDAYLPAGKGPWPVILTRTPYNKSSALGAGRPTFWTDKGYAIVVQDCRGRFASEGKYLPFMDDHFDGYDTVEWIAKQSWSNGKVGMTGVSAMGITSNQASITAPPHLTAMFVQLAPASAYQHAIYTGGIFRKEMNEMWLKSQKAEDILQLTIEHAKDDGFLNIREGKLHWEDVRVPVYNQGGWYDIFVQGNIDNFVGLQTHGGGLAAGNQKLMMGPWGHGNLDEVKYPSNASSLLDMTEQQRWFDYWLKGVSNGVMDDPPIRYYVMGDVNDPKAPGNEWRSAQAWPVPAKTTSFFLNSNSVLSEKILSEKESSTSYSYDPRNPVKTIGGANLFAKKGPLDQRATGERKDVLKFVTEPLASPVEVTGPLSVELWVSSDCPDTDFMAKLVDVYPDGTERLVQDNGLRARFREGFDREVMMKKGEVYKLKIDLWSTSLIFNKGHRIAVHITSSNDPRFDPNPNTGKLLRADSETRVAMNTIHHDAAHPSRILLPVVKMYENKAVSAR
ncbi:MAG: CocE/NonD family hydrolase [Blastocatellia bacterium]